jgi:rRNA maturation RNase YbeY
MGEINFFSERISYVVRRKGELRKWFVHVVECEGKIAGNLNFILCDDDYLAELNFKYLKHKTLTDILTFSFSEEGDILTGDVFISLPRVRDNARKYGQMIEMELHRVMVHGLLHLVGYNDTSKQEKLEMREREDYYLDIFSLSMTASKVV